MVSSMKYIRIIRCVLCAGLVFVGVSGVAVAVVAGSPVTVNRCDPIQGTVRRPPGFVRGFYPAGRRYVWRDVYGSRFRQWPFPVSTTAPTLNIEYTNVTGDPIHTIEFGLVARGSLIYQVRDVGYFSQGAAIRHSFGLNPNVFPIGTGLAQCVPLRVTWHNGKTWTNPHLPRLERSLLYE